MSDTPEYLTPDEFAAIYKIPKSTQSSMRCRRQIPFVLLGPRIPRYRRCDVERWLQTRTVAVLARPTACQEAT